MPVQANKSSTSPEISFHGSKQAVLHIKRPGQAACPGHSSGPGHCQMVSTHRDLERASEILNSGDGFRIHPLGHASPAGKTRGAGWQEHPQPLEPTEHNNLLVLRRLLQKHRQTNVKGPRFLCNLKFIQLPPLTSGESLPTLIYPQCNTEAAKQTLRG